MKDTQIELELFGSKGRAVLRDGDLVVAEMEYSMAGSSLLIISHTEVDEKLKGQGIGRKLLDKIVGHARENDIKIMPLCPFAKSVFDKDESIRDVLK
ncbi:MAG: GNAT family N-acetyltransferase [Bacteroidota bacterium]